jgi:hypothetical protein
MDITPITVVDDFFDDPDYVRKRALELNFDIEQNAPGKRAKCPDDISEIVAKKVFSLLFDMNRHIVNGSMISFFQITTKEFEEGWVHTDANGKFYFAGVIYLTPNAPIEAGTSIYKPIQDEVSTFEICDPLQKIKEEMYINKSNNLEEFKKARAKNNSLFYKTIDIGNVYNRLVVYPSNEFHRESKLFGSTKENARLTLVFFILNIASNSMPPIDRMKLIKDNYAT